jgi:hypothetical protein
MAVFGKVSDPSRPARCDRSVTGFQPVSEDRTAKMPVLQKPAEPACLEAKFALHDLVVNDGPVSSWPADSQRAEAHKEFAANYFPTLISTAYT